MRASAGTTMWAWFVCQHSGGRVLHMGHAIPRIKRGDLVRLRQRRIVKSVLDEIVQRALQVEHRLAELNQLGGALPHNVHAEQAPRVQREQHLQNPALSPMMCPRDVSRNRAIPHSYGMSRLRPSCSLMPTVEISGTEKMPYGKNSGAR